MFLRVLFVLAAVTVANCVFAEGISPDDHRLLARYDANGDQIISVDEIEDKRQRTFSRMDHNADGEVSFDEYEQLDQAKRLPLLKARFDKLDQDQDGHLSDAEYTSYLGRFETLDKNRDGKLSGSEMQTLVSTKPENDKPSADACLLWFCVRKEYK